MRGRPRLEHASVVGHGHAPAAVALLLVVLVVLVVELLRAVVRVLAVPPLPPFFPFFFPQRDTLTHTATATRVVRARVRIGRKEASATLAARDGVAGGPARS